MALLRGGEAGAGASALGPRRGGAGGGGRRRRGRARGGGRERAREGARRARPPSSQDPPLGPPSPGPARRQRLRRLGVPAPAAAPSPARPAQGRPGERPRRRVSGPRLGWPRRERIHLRRGARPLPPTRTHADGQRHWRPGPPPPRRGREARRRADPHPRAPCATDTHRLRGSPRRAGSPAHVRRGVSDRNTSGRRPRTQTHTHSLRMSPRQTHGDPHAHSLRGVTQTTAAFPLSHTQPAGCRLDTHTD